MKKIARILILLAVVSFSALTKGKAQEIHINARLTRPPEYEANERDHPDRPTPAHVWIAEEWVPANGTYTYQPGHWGIPTQPGAYWVKGHWTFRRHRGYIWIVGHWRTI